MDLFSRDLDMRTGTERKPVGDVDCLGRPHHISNGTKILVTEENITDSMLESQIISCKEPEKVALPGHHKKRFPLIEKAKAKLSNLFYRPLEGEAGKLFYHKDKTTKKGAFRKRRSTVRGRMTHDIGQIILHYNNIDHMMLGHFQGQMFVNYDTNLIYKHSNYSKKRIQETLRLFEDYGYISLKERKELLPDGSWKTYNSYISVNKQFYLDLGITETDFQKHYESRQKNARFEDTQRRRNEFFRNERRSRKEIKAIKRSLREVNEMPGSERKREAEPLYRDYTGLSSNREAVIKKNSTTETAGHFLANILKSLKPPS